MHIRHTNLEKRNRHIIIIIRINAIVNFQCQLE